MKDYCYVLWDKRDKCIVGAWTKLYNAVYDCVDMGATEDHYFMCRFRGMRSSEVDPKKWSAKYNENE